jgi:hypothetical protein
MDARFIFFLLLLFAAPTSGAQERCGASKDLMFQALERVSSGSNAEAENGLQLLKHANALCPTLGDAWYYRSLFEQKLHTQKSDYALSKARLLGSEAMDERLDPFHLVANAPAAENKAPAGPPRQKWALVIGIGRFADTRVPRLAYASKDAQDFAAVLEDPQVGRFQQGHVHTLLDGDATTHRIKVELNWLARNALASDLVVIFIATHGSPREFDSRDVNYIVTSDTEIKPQDELFATALGMVELTQVVRSRILALRTVILLDTCHSGAATGEAGVAVSSVALGTLDSIRQGVGRAILTSSTAGENSYENADAQNGYFTFYLVKALRESKGLAPIQKVYSYVHDQVASSVEAKYKLRQNPVLKQSEGNSEIVIGAAAEGH